MFSRCCRTLIQNAVDLFPRCDLNWAELLLLVVFHSFVILKECPETCSNDIAAKKVIFTGKIVALQNIIYVERNTRHARSIMVTLFI